MTKTTRSYVSAHVYQTPSGSYYDDRIGKRLTARRGSAAGNAQRRMQARVREEETGRLTFKRIKVKADTRERKPGKHTGSPDDIEAEIDTVYDPDINETFFQRYAEKRLDEAFADFEHWNVESLGFVDEET